MFKAANPNGSGADCPNYLTALLRHVVRESLLCEYWTGEMNVGSLTSHMFLRGSGLIEVGK